jgi:hypothetical protein
MCWAGAEVIELEPLADPRDSEYPASERLAVSADMLGAGDQGPGAGESGLLCSFTTGPGGAQSAPYTLTLDLRLYHTDPQTRTALEMTATTEFSVE